MAPTCWRVIPAPKCMWVSWPVGTSPPSTSQGQAATISLLWLLSSSCPEIAHRREDFTGQEAWLLPLLLPRSSLKNWVLARRLETEEAKEGGLVSRSLPWGICVGGGGVISPTLLTTSRGMVCFFSSLLSVPLNVMWLQCLMTPNFFASSPYSTLFSHVPG